MVSNMHYERPARTLVLAVALLCAIVLGLTLAGHYAFDRSMRENARDSETLVSAGHFAVGGARVKDDALAVASASSPAEFVRAKSRVYADLQSFESAHVAVRTEPTWQARQTLETNYRSMLRAAHSLALASSAKDAQASVPALTAAQARFDADVEDGLTGFAHDVNSRMGARLWLYGALLPGAFGFVIVALGAVLLPRALIRIRKVNDTLIQLEAASARQAGELEEQNAILHAQQEDLHNSQAELIMKTQQLEATSLGSQQAARRFEELFQGLPVACVGFSDEGLVFEWNRAATDLFGYDAYQVLHMKLWNHIADHAFARKGASIVRQVFLGKEFRDAEWEYRRPDGQPRQILGHLFPLRGVDGRILGGIAACLDVTDRKRAEEEVRSSEKLFRDLIDSLHEGVLLYDDCGRIVIANQQAGALLGAPQASLIGKRIDEVREDFVDESSNPLDQRKLPYRVCMQTGKPVENACVGFKGRPGRSSEFHWFSVSSIPLYRPNQTHPYGVLSSFSEITERLEYEDQLKSHMKALASAHQELKQRSDLLEQANAQLAALAVTDGLTSILNHRAFQERLEKEVTNCQDELSLVLLDVDHFKGYNDTFGHPEGDGVLRRVAVIMQESIGDRGIAARYGGEEFAIILPGFDATAAAAFGDQLCDAVARSPWPNRSVTISAGVATLGGADITPEALIRSADAALYDSKRAGRNRSTHAQTLKKAA
ncbi:MAG TPA: diguanylate cyclase [Fimbriimonadaceae bacterium]|nr:diguanylate cyclase [Fimbriimonadaceae bacterium]